MRRLPLIAAVVALVAAACGDGGDDAASPAPVGDRTTRVAPAAPDTTAGGTPTEPGTLPAAVPLDAEAFATVATDLVVPWAIAFVDERTFLVTERPGRVRLFRDGRLQPGPVATVAVQDVGEGGLLGMALHPDFAVSRFAYVYYTASGGNRLSRYAVAGDFSFGDEEILLDGIPASRFHNGGRVAFGPDGMLYVTTGDAQEPRLAADLGSLAGKVLRLTPDGSVPDDNPFEGSPIWTYGHRNPQGLGWDGDGNLYASEHGPSGELGLCCHDEINLIRAGQFYGWPFVTGFDEALGGTPPEEPMPPIASSGQDTWAPAGLAVQQGAGGPELLVANLRARQVLRVPIAAGDPASVGDIDAVAEQFGRLRIATFGPDGCLYLASSNRDGRGAPDTTDDKILRSCP